MVAEAGGEKGENHGNSNLVPSGGRGDESRNTDYEGDADEESIHDSTCRERGGCGQLPHLGCPRMERLILGADATETEELRAGAGVFDSGGVGGNVE